MRQQEKKGGFTLIELLVVIGIIAILAAILFPVFAKARERAKVTTCQSNLKNVVYALHMYTDDNSGHLPFPQYFGRVWFLLQVNGNPNAATGPYIQDLLQPYVKNDKVWLCPSLSPNEHWSRNPDWTASYDMSKYYVKDNCGTSKPWYAPSNYMWMHWRWSNGHGNIDANHSWVSGRSVSLMKEPVKVMLFLEFPYWTPGPHRIIDGSVWEVANDVAFYDAHVKLTKFGNHAYLQTYEGWEDP